MEVIGTCSLCGGDVMGYKVWHGTIPPPARCSRCGANRVSQGPVIPMARHEDTSYTTITTTINTACI